MKRYVRVFLVTCYLNFFELTAFRANFFNSLISDFVWGIFSLLSIYLLTTNVTSIYGWNRTEILLISSLYTIFMGFFHTFFSASLDNLAETIYLGKLDTLLLRPIDTQYSASVRYINYTNMFRIFFGTFMSIMFLRELHVSVQPFGFITFMMLMICGLLLFYSIWFLCITLTIWNPRLSNVLDFMYSIGSVARYPQEMYKHLAQYAFYFLLPMLLIVNTPTKSILGKMTFMEEIQLVGCSIVFLYISRKFWLFALRFYASGGN